MSYAIGSKRIVRFAGRTPVQGAATEIILNFSSESNPAKRVIIQRVHLVRISGTGANYTPRIVSKTGGVA